MATKTQSPTLRYEVQTSGRMGIDITNVYARPGQMSVSSVHFFPDVLFGTNHTTVWYILTCGCVLNDAGAFTGLPTPSIIQYSDKLGGRRAEPTGT